jgi:predicted nucleic acid-binding protein
VTLCIDTNAYTAFKRGHKQIQALLEAADEVVVPTIVLGELYAGFAIGSRERTNLKELGSFLQMPGIIIAPVSERVAERYGTLIRTLKSQGMPMPTNDVWIASTALETGARLLSLDVHFQRIPAVVYVPLDPL